MVGYTLAFEGRPRNPGQMGRGGVDAFLVEPRLFPGVVGAAVYRLFGFGLVQGRVAALLFAFVFAMATWTVMRSLFGPLAAAVTTGLTVVDPWFFICGRTLREEIFLAALIWLGFGLLLRAVGTHGGFRALLGGLCIGIAHWTHPNALVFTLAALSAFLCVSGWRMFRGKWLLWTVAGVALGISPYVAYCVYAQSTGEVDWATQVFRRSGAFARPWSETLATEILRWRNFIRLPERFPVLVLYLWGAAWAAVRGQRADRLLLVFIAVSALLLPIIQPVETSRYYIVLVPALAALVWRSLAYFLENAGIQRVQAGDSAYEGECSLLVAAPRHSVAERMRKPAVFAALAVYAALSIGPTAMIVYAQRRADYAAWAARIAKHIPKEASVMASTMFWTGLHDRRFISNHPPFFTEWANEADAADFIRRHRPEFLVQSSLLYTGVGGIEARTDDLRATVIGRASEQVAREQNGRVLDEFHDPDFGANRIWALRWPTSP